MSDCCDANIFGPLHSRVAHEIEILQQDESKDNNEFKSEFKNDEFKNKSHTDTTANFEVEFSKVTNFRNKKSELITVTGNIDYIDYNKKIIYEFKCTETLNPINLVQLALYKYLSLNSMPRVNIGEHVNRVKLEKDMPYDCNSETIYDVIWQSNTAIKIRDPNNTAIIRSAFKSNCYNVDKLITDDFQYILHNLVTGEQKKLTDDSYLELVNHCIENYSKRL